MVMNDAGDTTYKSLTAPHALRRERRMEGRVWDHAIAIRTGVARPPRVMEVTRESKEPRRV